MNATIEALPNGGPCTARLDLDCGPFTVFTLSADATGACLYAHALHTPTDDAHLTWYAMMMDAADRGEVRFAYTKDTPLRFGLEVLA